MTVSLFGIFVIIQCVFFALKYANSPRELLNKAVELAVITGIFLDVGYILRIGEFVLEYNYLFSFFAFFAGLYYFYSKRYVDGNRVLLLMALLFSIVLNLLVKYVAETKYYSASISGAYSGNGWEQIVYSGKLNEIQVQDIPHTIIRLVFLLIIIFAYSYSAKYEDIMIICKKIRNYSIAYLIFLFVEAFIRNVGLGDYIRDIEFIIFGKSDSTVIVARQVGGIDLPLGLAREPSNLAMSLAFIVVALILYYKNRKNGKLHIALAILALMSTGAMSAVMYGVGIAYLIYISSKKNLRKILIAISPIAIVGFVILCKVAFGNRVMLLIENVYLFDSGPAYLSYHSEVVRMYSIYNNFLYLLQYPLFGTGFGTVFSYSALITLVTNIGILGAIIFFGFYFRSMREMLGKRKLHIAKLILLIILWFGFSGHIGYILYYEKTFIILLMANLIIDNRTYGGEKKEKYNNCIVANNCLSC